MRPQSTLRHRRDGLRYLAANGRLGHLADRRRCVLAVGEMLTTSFFLAPFARRRVRRGARRARSAAASSIAGRRLRGRSTLACFGSCARSPRRHLQHAAAACGPAPRRSSAAPAIVLERIANDEGVGSVRLDGEVWTARAYDEDQVIEAGTRVQVVEIRGATALVDDMSRPSARSTPMAGSDRRWLVARRCSRCSSRRRPIRIIPQARAGVVERLGRYSRTLTPGLTIVVPFIDRVQPLIDLREQVVTLPAAAGDHRGQRRRSRSTPSSTSRSPTRSRRPTRSPTRCRRSSS